MGFISKTTNCSLIVLVALGSAAGSCHNVKAQQVLLPKTPSQAISNLRKLHEKPLSIFVPQGDLDPVIHEGGGGACPAAAAIDAIQVLRRMSGRDPIPNPHR